MQLGKREREREREEYLRRAGKSSRFDFFVVSDAGPTMGAAGIVSGTGLTRHQGRDGESLRCIFVVFSENSSYLYCILIHIGKHGFSASLEDCISVGFLEDPVRNCTDTKITLLSLHLGTNSAVSARKKSWTVKEVDHTIHH